MTTEAMKHAAFIIEAEAQIKDYEMRIRGLRADIHGSQLAIIEAANKVATIIEVD